MTERGLQIIFGRRHFRIPRILFFVVTAFVLWTSYTVGFVRGRVDGYSGPLRETELQVSRTLQATPSGDFSLNAQLGQEPLGDADTLEGIEKAREGIAPSATGANLESGPDPPREFQAESVFAETRSSRVAAVRSTYLQVVAARTRPELDRVITELKSNGYAPIVDRSGNDGWIRALIGPVADDQLISDLQGELSEAGFDSFPQEW